MGFSEAAIQVNFAAKFVAVPTDALLRPASADCSPGPIRNRACGVIRSGESRDNRGSWSSPKMDCQPPCPASQHA
jgi:hypothetical protein